MTIDRTRFFAVARLLFAGGLSNAQSAGLTAILDGWEAWSLANAAMSPNIRWLAYELATTFHETGQAMVPVREEGEGAGYNYGLPQRNGQRYYGRGLVQLTGASNYQAFGARLGIPLYDNPDLALIPSHALAIMFDGMARGSFTGKRLGQYFGPVPSHDDPLNARRIINGLDQATAIAQYHRTFLLGLVPAFGALPARPAAETTADLNDASAAGTLDIQEA